MTSFPFSGGPISRSRRPHIILAASGSLEAVRFEELCVRFMSWADVEAVATNNAMRFIGKTHLPNNSLIITDEHDWSFWKFIGDPVLHITLQDWADAMVIAPLSANTLAKIAGGLCDNLLTSIVRAWDHSKPMFVAPAMDPSMWTNSRTEEHMVDLDDMLTLIPPISDGISGLGPMAPISHIENTVRLYMETRGYY